MSQWLLLQGSRNQRVLLQWRESRIAQKLSTRSGEDPEAINTPGLALAVCTKRAPIRVIRSASRPREGGFAGATRIQLRPSDTL